MGERKRNWFDVIYLILCIHLFVNGAPVRANGDILVITLEDALDIAMKNNNDVLIANEEIDIAAARIREARSAALPNITAEHLYTRNLRLPAFFLTFDDKITKITVGSNNSFSGQVVLAQPLWLAGKVGNALKIAQRYKIASTEASNAVRNEVRYAVKELFYGILLAREALTLSRQSLEQNESHFSDVKRKFDQGVASEFDLLRAEVRVANSQPAVIQAENRLELLHTALKNVLGFDPEQEIQIQGDFKYLPFDGSVIEEGNDGALSRRPELKGLELTSQMFALNVKIEKGNWFPSLYLVGAGQFMGQSNDFRLRATQRNFSYNVGLQLQFPIFDGLRTSARIEQAELQYQKTLYQIDKLKDGIRTEIRQTVLKMREADKTVQALIRNLDQATKAYTIAKVRYDNGIGTQLELFDAQLTRDMAHMNYLQGIYDYLIFQAAWNKAVGR